jgi:hypothetical protein
MSVFFPAHFLVNQVSAITVPLNKISWWVSGTVGITKNWISILVRNILPPNGVYIGK